jgi:hypothetical protein
MLELEALMLKLEAHTNFKSNPPSSNMIFLGRFTSEVAENLTAFLSRQPPLIQRTSFST